MNRRSIKDITFGGLGALGMALCLTLANGAAAPAQAAPLTARGAIDRAEIEDLLARYYWNFGKSGKESFASFYTPDAELVLGKTSFKGTAGIESAYSGVPKDAPQRTSYSLNILMSNPLITVHGDTATAHLVFTEIIVEKQGDPPKILTQGREFDHLKRQHGEWRIAKRQIVGAADKPADWPN